MSDETQKIVDEEVKRFVEEGYQTAQTVIRENIDDLHTIAKALLEYETLTGDEIRDLMDGKPPVREIDADSDAQEHRRAVGRQDRQEAPRRRARRRPRSRSREAEARRSTSN